MPPQNVNPRKMPFDKYAPFVPIVLTDRTWPNVVIDRAPRWCSVDLRDGNQALIDPMDPTRKLRMFTELVAMGFKEIEVGFPSPASPTSTSCRQLIEEDLIPDDVTIQVLVQCRQELIERTYECDRRALPERSCTSTTRPTRCSARWCSASTRTASSTWPSTAPSCAASSSTMGDTQIRYEYSPESFTLTEPEFAIEVCEAVMDVIEPTPTPDHPQPAGHGRVLLPQRVRRRDRVVRPHDQAARLGDHQPAPPQRPRVRGRRRRVRRDGRRRPGRGHAVRQRRAHRQRRRRQRWR
jgi:2-isopropylmalate synthase